jgi:hypothetical protein
MQISNGTGPQQHDKRKVNGGRIPSDTLRQIHKLAKEGHPANEIAILTDISEAAIERSLSGKSHQAIWLEFNPGKEPPGGLRSLYRHRYSEQSSKPKLDAEMARNILTLAAQGQTPDFLSRAFGLAYHKISEVLTGMLFPEVYKEFQAKLAIPDPDASETILPPIQPAATAIPTERVAVLAARLTELKAEESAIKTELRQLFDL